MLKKTSLTVAAVAGMIFGLAAQESRAALIESADGEFFTGFEAGEGYSTTEPGPHGGVGALQGQEGWVRHRVRGVDPGTVDEDNQFRVVDSGGRLGRSRAVSRYSAHFR